MDSRTSHRALLVLACLSLLVHGGTPAEQPADPVQTYVDAVRVKLSAGKVNLINDMMKMSAKEAAAFWPLYHEYEVELFEIGDRRLELIERLVAAHRTESLDDSEAKTMASDYFELSTARIELFRKYHDLIATELSPIRAVQFVQIENRISMVIDIMIASELPLFKYDGVPSAAQSGIPSPSTNRLKARADKSGTTEEEEGV